MPGDPRQSSTVLGTLTALTVVSGMVDAACFLGLGRVFTANMTGNLVLFGFSLVGATGLSVGLHLTSLLCFVAGAVAAGRLSVLVGSVRWSMVVAIAVEVVLVAGAAAVTAVHGGTVVQGWERTVAVAELAVAMGVRNASARQLGVPDFATTVVTTTLAGLAGESSLAGGTNPRAGRRLSAVVALLAGAVAGAALTLHQGPAWALAFAAAVSLVALAVFAASPVVSGLDGPAAGGV